MLFSGYKHVPEHFNFSLPRNYTEHLDGIVYHVVWRTVDDATVVLLAYFPEADEPNVMELGVLPHRHLIVVYLPRLRTHRWKARTHRMAWFESSVEQAQWLR